MTAGPLAGARAVLEKRAEGNGMRSHRNLADAAEKGPKAKAGQVFLLRKEASKRIYYQIFHFIVTLFFDY